jgi:O-antigen ligase
VLFTHQARGLANPFNPAVSTLPSHFAQFKAGLRSAISNPLGHGVGAVTTATGKFGAPNRGTETDLSNAAVALGIPGLLSYFFLVTLALRQAYAFAAARRDSLALAVLGLLAVTLFQWLNGGQYAVAFLPWLALGWMDRTISESKDG